MTTRKAIISKLVEHIKGEAMPREFFEETEQAKFVEPKEITPVAFEAFMNFDKAAMVFASLSLPSYEGSH